MQEQPHINEELPSILPEYAEDPEVKKKISNARKWLYAIAALQALAGVYEFFTIADDTLRWLGAGIDIGLAAAFGGLAAFTHKKPFAALLTALILYCTVIILLAINDPSTLMKSGIIRIFFITAMIKGIKTAREAEALKQFRD